MPNNKNRIWKLNKSNQVDLPGVNPIIDQLLINRGLDTKEKIQHFFEPDFVRDLHDPFLFKDMSKAAERILKAVESQEKIFIYGDYDADGVCSTAVMSEYLKAIGANFEVYIPFREKEGYGLNLGAAQTIVDSQAKLVITVDCGISNSAEVNFFNSHNVEVIISDHHQQPLVMPEAYAIINPNVSTESYPFKGLTGSGVAFKLVSAMASLQYQYKITHTIPGWEKWLLDLVAIGTVADLQPLVDENRIFVKYGLMVLNKANRVGLVKMFSLMSSDIKIADEKTIGWQVAPRLNAAGRLNHASVAYNLLVTADENEGTRLAEELNKTNNDRQQLTEKIKAEARSQIGESPSDEMLIVIGDEWPTGVVGLVAGRLTDEFHRPSMVISRFNGEIIGSGRSIPEYNIIAELKKCDQYLKRYGGHPQACGFTVKDEASLSKVSELMKRSAHDQLANLDLRPTLEIDCEVNLEDVDWKMFNLLSQFSPFGEANPKPRFVAYNLTVVELRQVGKDNQHLRLLVKHNSELIKKTIAFSFGDWHDKLNPGDNIDIVFEVDRNDWNGTSELQLRIIDIKKS